MFCSSLFFYLILFLEMLYIRKKIENEIKRTDIG